MRIKHAIKSHHHEVLLHCGLYLCVETRMRFHILSFFSLSLVSLALFSFLHGHEKWVCVFNQINDKKSQLEIIFRINWNIEYVIEHNLIKIQMIWNRACDFVSSFVRFLFTISWFYSNEWQKMCNKASKHTHSTRINSTQLSQVWQI